MRIYAKKAFRFRNVHVKIENSASMLDPKQSKDMFFICKPGEHQTAPDWIKHDTMFKAGVENETIFVINEKASDTAVEKAMDLESLKASKKMRQSKPDISEAAGLM